MPSIDYPIFVAGPPALASLHPTSYPSRTYDLSISPSSFCISTNFDHVATRSATQPPRLYPCADRKGIYHSLSCWQCTLSAGRFVSVMDRQGGRKEACVSTSCLMSRNRPSCPSRQIPSMSVQLSTSPYTPVIHKLPHGIPVHHTRIHLLAVDSSTTRMAFGPLMFSTGDRLSINWLLLYIYTPRALFYQAHLRAHMHVLSCSIPPPVSRT